MANIDPIEFGKLTNAVERLEKDVYKLTEIIQKMDNDMTKGKGIVFGMLMFAGGLGAGITKLIEQFNK
jgi:hypothetical protein